MNIKTKTIAFSTGGTAGHIFPAEALYLSMRSKYKSIWIIDQRGLKYIDTLHKKAQNRNSFLILHGLRIAGSLLNKLRALFYLVIDTLRAVIYLQQNSVTLLLIFGGYACVPSALAALILRIPIIIHEQNTILGKANAALAPFAKIIATSFPETIGIKKKYVYKVRFCGLLVREEFKKQDLIAVNNNESLSNLDQQCKLLNILILGGSQGAENFSNLVSSAICMLETGLKAQLQINHQTTEKNLTQIMSLYMCQKFANYSVSTFFQDIERYIANATIIISRSGASTIGELIFLKKISVLIPMPNSAQNHQYHNALYLSKQHAAIMVEENSITSENLANIIGDLLVRKDISQEYKKNISILREVHLQSMTNLIYLVENVIRSI